MVGVVNDRPLTLTLTNVPDGVEVTCPGDWAQAVAGAEDIVLEIASSLEARSLRLSPAP